MTLIAGYSAGGGFDLYSRVIANYLGKHIPGQPRIVVQNMPGAGSLRAASHVYNVAPKDGTVISLTRAPVIAPLLGSARRRRLRRDEVHLARQRRERPHRLRAARQSQDQHRWPTRCSTSSRWAASAPAPTKTCTPRSCASCSASRRKLVSGYPGGAEMVLAVERGELDGRCGWAWSSIKISRPDWIADKKIKVLNVLALERSPELPDVPSIMEFVKQSATSRSSGSS